MVDEPAFKGRNAIVGRDVLLSYHAPFQEPKTHTRTNARTHAFHTILQRYALIQRRKTKTQAKQKKNTRAPYGRPRFRAGAASPRGKLIDALAVPLFRLHHLHLVLAAAAFVVPAALVITATSISPRPLVAAHAAGSATAATAC